MRRALAGENSCRSISDSGSASGSIRDRDSFVVRPLTADEL